MGRRNWAAGGGRRSLRNKTSLSLRRSSVTIDLPLAGATLPVGVATACQLTVVGGGTPTLIWNIGAGDATGGTLTHIGGGVWQGTITPGAGDVAEYQLDATDGGAATDTQIVSVVTVSAASTASAYVGPFSLANYFSSAADDGIEMTDGHTIVCLFWVPAGGVATQQIIWGYQSDASHGWYLRLHNGTGSVGAVYGIMRLAFVGGTGEMVFPATVRWREGLNCVAITRSGTALRVSCNGSTAALMSAAPTYVANGSPATQTIGRAFGTANPATAACVVACAAIDATLSDADLKTATSSITALERWHLPTVVTSHASLRYLLRAEDWAGHGNTWTAGSGSAPPTLTENGTVPQATLAAEKEYTFNIQHIGDSATPVDNTTYWGHDSWATIEVTTDATQMAVDTYQTAATQYEFHHVGADEGASYVCRGQANQNSTETVRLDLLGLSAGSKTVRLTAGLVTSSSRLGVKYGRKLVFPASASVQIGVLRATSPAHRVLLIGDSISIGQDGVPIAQNAWGLLMRREWTTRRVTFDGYGSRRLADDSGDLPGFATATAARLDGTTSNTLIVALGTVDYGGATGTIAHADFQTYLGTWLDAVHVAKPAAVVYILTPLTRTSESTPNTVGSTLPDFRTACSNVQSTRSSWITLIAGPSACTNFAADGLHPNTAGQQEIEAYVQAVLGY